MDGGTCDCCPLFPSRQVLPIESTYAEESHRAQGPCHRSHKPCQEGVTLASILWVVLESDTCAFMFKVWIGVPCWLRETDTN